MRSRWNWMGVVSGSFIATCCAAQSKQMPVITISAQIDNMGGMVSPGAMVNWSLFVEGNPTDGTLGLAGFSCDLRQSFSNPATLALSAGSAVLPIMEKFARPLGIANPAPTGSSAADGYGGTPSALAGGGSDLLQIGGCQNTFGVQGAGFGTSTTPTLGIGLQSSPHLVAQGAFVAPQQVGTYYVDLVDCLANVLTQVATGPIAVGARAYVNQGLSFVVTCGRADFNSSGTVTVQDLFDFLSAWFAVNPTADVNNSGSVTVQDLFDFLTLWFDGCSA